ncbi:unnamed protein product, partial [Polarella glacialis]
DAERQPEGHGGVDGMIGQGQARGAVILAVCGRLAPCSLWGPVPPVPASLVVASWWLPRGSGAASHPISNNPNTSSNNNDNNNDNNLA